MLKTKQNKWVFVKSSMVNAVRYDPVNATLEVRFTNDRGPVYKYRAVPEPVYNDLLKAKSIGRFLHENIFGGYDY